MSKVNYQQLKELSEIVHDHTAPMETRMMAHGKYQAGLDAAVEEAREHLEQIKRKGNESGNSLVGSF